MSLFLGLDPSSNKIGFAIVDQDGELVKKNTFGFRPKEGWTDTNIGPGVLWAFGYLAGEINAIRHRHNDEDIEGASVELVAVTRNMDTVRKIAYFEAACMMASSWFEIPVRQVRVTSARLKILGKGNLKKEQTQEILEHGYGELTLDESDALLLALMSLVESLPDVLPRIRERIGVATPPG